MNPGVVIRQDVHISVLLFVFFLRGCFTGSLDGACWKSVEFLPEKFVVISHPPINLLLQFINRQWRVLSVGAGRSGKQRHALGLHVICPSIGQVEGV